MRAMGLDIGDVRIGVALSDPMRIIASPFETYTRKGFDRDVAYILQLAEENSVTDIACGLPLTLAGKDSLQTAKARKFADALRQSFSGRLHLIDERLTTASASRTLIEGGVRRENRKAHVDKLAAALILRTYLGV